MSAKYPYRRFGVVIDGEDRARLERLHEARGVPRCRILRELIAEAAAEDAKKAASGDVAAESGA